MVKHVPQLSSIYPLPPYSLSSISTSATLIYRILLNLMRILPCPQIDHLCIIPYILVANSCKHQRKQQYLNISSPIPSQFGLFCLLGRPEIAWDSQCTHSDGVIMRVRSVRILSHIQITCELISKQELLYLSLPAIFLCCQNAIDCLVIFYNVRPSLTLLICGLCGLDIWPCEMSERYHTGLLQICCWFWA